jgi:hypothetical protein
VKFKILGIFTDGSKLEYTVIAADRRRPLDNNMRTDNSAGFYLDLRAHNTVWTYFNIVSDHGRFINDRGFVYHGGYSFSVAAQSISATVTSSPSTLASQENFQMIRVLFSSFTFSVS